MRSKFIIGEISSQDLAMDLMAAVIFPESITHADIARKLFVEGSIVSAGFVCFDKEGKPFSYGDSVGLKIKSRGEKDQRLLETALGMR